MQFAQCRRCRGTGQGNDQNPTRPGAFNWCAGCNGDGNVQVIDPQVACNRCRGTGRFTDQNPTKQNVFDWCAACEGTGYAK